MIGGHAEHAKSKQLQSNIIYFFVKKVTVKVHNPWWQVS